MVKNLSARAGDVGLIHGWGNTLEKEMTTPVFLPEKFHGQRSLVGYSLQGHKRVEHDLMTENERTKIIGYQIYH